MSLQDNNSKQQNGMRKMVQAVWEKDEKEVGVGETGGRWIGRDTGKRNKKYVRRTHSFFRERM